MLSSPSSSWRLLLASLCLLPNHVTAFPSLLVNACDRPMQVGEVVMGVPVAPSGNAPAAQSHTLNVAAASGDTTSLCGTTVTQGTPLSLAVDPTLVGLVTADGWSQGVGPNYLVEATNALLITDDVAAERGCGDSRMVNPVDTTILPLEGGETVVRLLSAYGFGQVWASDECTITVTGDRTVARHDGFLVDAATFANQADLATEPYTLSAQALLQASSFALLEQLEDDTFVIKYNIRPTDEIASFLQGLPANETNIQVSVIGFEEDASTVDLVSLSRCSSSATCDGFFSIPTDRVCVTDGLCVASSIVDVDADTITVTIESDDDSWFAIGFSTSGGGMTAGGSGSDIFACSDEGLRRFVVTSRTNPSTSAASSEILEQDDADDEFVRNLCVLDADNNQGRMTFTRPLTDGELRPIVTGSAQAIIYARGPAGEQALASQHPAGRRGEVALDLTNLGSGVSNVKIEAEWILWCHIVFMSLSWGFCLPLAVVIASRTRNVKGGKPGSWFRWHKSLSRVGWTLQTMGALFGIYYCEVYSIHLEWEHTKLGVFIAIAGFLQPVSALLRPHPPKDGWVNGPPITRTLFEIYHKGIGWVAMICGVVNVFLGADLVKDLGFKEITSNFPISIGSIGAGLATLFFILGTVMPDNPVSKTLTGAKPGSD